MKKHVIVSMVNIRSNKEETTENKLTRLKNAPITEVEHATPEQSIDEVERKTTDSTPMPNAEEQETKTIEFSTIGNGNDVTSNTPETKKDDSRTKRTSFKERSAAMVKMRPRDMEEVITGTDKSQTFGTVSAITTEAGEGGKQITERTAGHSARPVIESKVLRFSWET